MRRKLKSFGQIVALVIIDLFAFYVALVIAIYIRTDLLQFFIPDMSPLLFTLQYAFSVTWIPVVYIIVIAFESLYKIRYPFWEETRNLAKALMFAVLIVFFVVYVRKMFGQEPVIRTVFIIHFFVSLFIFPLCRFWGKRALYKLGIWRENVIILGAGENATLTIKGLSREEHLGYHVIGLLDDDPKKIGSFIEIGKSKYKIYGEISNFTKFVSVLDIQTVFIVNPYPTEELTNLVNNVYRYVKKVIVIPDIKGVSIFNSELHYLFTEKLFMIKMRNSLNSDANMIFKRLFDMTVSFVGLIVILPFVLILMLLVKLTSRGPIFYSQDRVGKGGKIFKALKFRSMFVDADEQLKKILESNPEARKEWETSYKMKNDPRITWIGKFLRRSSMDELPQIFNILKGEMSLVGPRPVKMEEIEKYYGTYADYYYSVTPGLTGLWQVSGRSDTDYNFRVQTDVWYIQNWNLWLDIMILLRTPLVVIKGKGAY